MKRSGAAVLGGFILAALIIVGVLFLGREILHLYRDLDPRFLAVSILVIFASLIIAAGLRRSGEASVRQFRTQNKAHAYSTYLCALGRCEDNLGSDSARELAVWASSRVLRAIDARPEQGGSDKELREWLAWLLREMRQDLGQSNLQLKLDSVLNGLLSGDGSKVDDCKLN